jgi:hypothetical protein
VLWRLIDRLDGQGKQRKAGGRSGIHGGAAEQRKGKGRWEEGEAPTGGAVTSVAQGKRKREAEGVGRRGELDGPLGPPGLKGSRRWFLFFQTSFSNQIHFKFKSNLSNFFPRIL